MSLDEEYTEKIRIKKNNCIVNIMRCYLDILYNRKKIVQTDHTKILDRDMFRTVEKEINKLMEDFK